MTPQLRKRSDIRTPVKPTLTKAQKAYMQGWGHGTKGEIKQGPANQKDERLRAAYLQGFEHGSGDRENAAYHCEHNHAD